MEVPMKVVHEHVIDVPVDRVVEAYKSEDFYVAKLKNSGAITVEVLEREEMPDGRIRMKARASEPSRVPAFLRKSDVDEYVDENELDPNRRVFTWRITPHVMADRFFLYGDVRFEPQGEGRTKLIFTTNLDVKVPLVGGRAEKIGLSKTEEEVLSQVRFIEKWVKEHERDAKRC